MSCCPDPFIATRFSPSALPAERHQLDRHQDVADIDRYALYRRHDVYDVQLTKELLRQPRVLVRRCTKHSSCGGTTDPRRTSALAGAACSCERAGWFRAGDAGSGR